MSVIEDLKRHEGFRATPYMDTTGHLTVGYGLNLDAGITEEEATMLLVHRVEKIRATLRKRLPCFSSLSEARQGVLINMSFNLGVDGLMGFKQTLRYVAEGNYSAAADQMMGSRWADQVKGRAMELSDIMRRG